MTFLSRLGIANAELYTGRRAIVETLGRGGLRVSELCDLKIRDARLHDPTRSGGPASRSRCRPTVYDVKWS